MNKDSLKKSIRDILITEDPLGIYFPDDHNIEEYDFEIDVIIRLLPDISNEDYLVDKIYQVFKTSFGENKAGSKSRYKNIASKIWELIKKDKSN